MSSRKVIIPSIYETMSGEGKFLNPAELTYDESNEIIEVGVWNENGIMTYTKGEFKVDTDLERVSPLYQEKFNSFK